MITEQERKILEEALWCFKRELMPRLSNDLIERLCKIALASGGLVEALEHYESAHYSYNGFPCAGDGTATESLAKFNKAVSGE